MKNDVKKSNEEKYVEEKKNKLMGEILKFKYISRVGKETILDNFIRQIINDRKVRVSRVFVTNWILKLEEMMIVYDEGRMITHESLIKMLNEAGVEIEDK